MTIDYQQRKPLKECPTPPKARGLHLAGVLVRTHQTIQKQQEERISMTKEAPEGALSSPRVLGATVGYQWSLCPKMTLTTSLSTN
jgi:hypothetical protein